MFRTNNTHGQQSFFDGRQWLPEALRQRLEDSWAGTFYREVFCRIPEEPFAPLYSDGEALRPNAPLNVLMGAEILKSGFGWSDLELIDHVRFDLQVRHALGLDDLREEIFTLRTLYNFRRRVREHAEETGTNVYAKVFEQVTDKPWAQLPIDRGRQQMDRTQVLSTLADWSRLEWLIAVVQQVYADLPPEVQARWAEEAGPYLEGRPRHVSQRLKSSETEMHLQRLGELLVAWEAVLAQVAPESEALALAQRGLREP
ncbi:MAG: transposase [Anaerolineae bacterium]